MRAQNSTKSVLDGGTDRQTENNIPGSGDKYNGILQNVQLMKPSICVLYIALYLTLIRTSPAFGGATETVSMDSGFFASHATAALHSIVCTVKTATLQNGRNA